MRKLPQLSNAAEWRLLSSEVLQSGRVGTQWKIPNRTIVIEDSFVCAVGARNAQAKPTWFLAGWASMNLLLSPPLLGSFTGYSQAARRRLQLDQLNLLVFPKLQSPWALELSFPWWHDSMEIEIWRYDGADIDELQRLDELGQKIDQQYQA